MDHKEHWAMLQQVVADILTTATNKGATEVEAGASINVGLSCTVRLGEIETIEFNRDKSIGVTVYHGKRKGSTSSSDIDMQSILQVVDMAGRIAEYTEEDPYNGLAFPKHLAKNIPALDLYHPADVQPELAIEIAKNCEMVAMAVDKRINNSEGASFSANVSYRVYGNTNGFLSGYPSSSYSLSCTVIGQEGNSMQRDFDYTVARCMQDLNSYQNIGQSAANRTIARLGSRKLKTCKAPVLFYPSVAKSLLASFVSAISGTNLYRKSSFLLDFLHKKVFADFINIKEEPLLPKALGSTPFDNEGVATVPKTIVKNGVLQGYVLNSYSARKLGLETTGNAGGVHNLILEAAGNNSFNELLKTMGTGLVAMELMGHGVNIVTGDYSRGVAGFWVENGVIQYPVEEVTIASNLKDMFLRVLAVGNDLDFRSNIITGSILIEEMTIAGN